MNLRSKKVIPIVIKRDRRRGKYRINASIHSDSITKDKAEKLEICIQRSIVELGLIGVVSLVYDVKDKGNEVPKRGRPRNNAR